VRLGAAVLLAVMTGWAQETAPRHELGLTLGSIRGASRGEGASSLELGSGMALQANYGLRLFGGDNVAVYGEVHFLANPLREVTSANGSLTRDAATIFLTPGLRVKFRPRSRVQPYAVVGGGYALFEQSLLTIGGAPNPAPRFAHRGTFMFGGGVDVPIWRFVAARGEIRDFYSGSPAYNAPSLSGGQHNVVVGGGIVLRFR
jgi:opacity protein-like surface antigen